MHDAFEHAVILEKLPLQIDCIATFGKIGNYGILRDKITAKISLETKSTLVQLLAISCLSNFDG